MSCQLGKVVVDFGNGGFTIKADASLDGNQYCVLFGPNLQEGIAGFGSTLNDAVGRFRLNVRNDMVEEK